MPRVCAWEIECRGEAIKSRFERGFNEYGRGVISLGIGNIGKAIDLIEISFSIDKQSGKGPPVSGNSSPRRKWLARDRTVRNLSLNYIAVNATKDGALSVRKFMAR